MRLAIKMSKRTKWIVETISIVALMAFAAYEIYSGGKLWERSSLFFKISICLGGGYAVVEYISNIYNAATEINFAIKTEVPAAAGSVARADQFGHDAAFPTSGDFREIFNHPAHSSTPGVLSASSIDNNAGGPASHANVGAMKTITLSDHTADKVSSAAAKRKADYVAAAEAHRDALASWEARLTALRATVLEALKKWQLFAAVESAFQFGLTYRSEKPVAPNLRAPDREEIIWAVGNEGERRVSAHLAKNLSNEWTLISGYHNAKGEIDQILVGPRGVFAIEIKFINGVIHCDGDKWSSDKYDKYGNLVEARRPIADKGGRSPSQQINESADQLELFLAKRCNLNRVHRTVVLSHESSRLGEIGDLTVDAVATIQSLDLERLFSRSQVTLDSGTIDRIVQTIRVNSDLKLIQFFSEQRFKTDTPRSTSLVRVAGVPQGGRSPTGGAPATRGAHAWLSRVAG